MAINETVEIPVTIDIARERQKPRLIALLFCDFFNLTNDKKGNLLGVFDRVYVPRTNSVTPRFTLFLRTAETHQGAVRTTIIAPNNKAVNQFVSIPDDADTIIEGIPVNLQSMISIQFQAEVEGVYWFDVSYEGESLGGAGLVVEFRDAEVQKRGTDTYP